MTLSVILTTCRAELSSEIVTLRRISGNKVNAHTWLVLTCTHSSDTTPLMCGYGQKKFDFG